MVKMFFCRLSLLLLPPLLTVVIFVRGLPIEKFEMTCPYPEGSAPKVFLTSKELNKIGSYLNSLSFLGVAGDRVGFEFEVENRCYIEGGSNQYILFEDNTKLYYGQSRKIKDLKLTLSIFSDNQFSGFNLDIQDEPQSVKADFPRNIESYNTLKNPNLVPQGHMYLSINLIDWHVFAVFLALAFAWYGIIATSKSIWLFLGKKHDNSSTGPIPT